MGRLFKFILGAVLLSVAGGALYVAVMLPQSQPASDVRIQATADVIERGRYLATNVVLCLDCHSDRDWTVYGGPALAPYGAGRAECITEESGKSGIRVSEWTFPGRICIPNITPDEETGIGSWTDGEIIRAFREGIGRDGRPLFPIMPYFILRNISDEDAEAIVAYLRTLSPVNAAHADPIVKFPMNLFMKVFPEPVREPIASVDPHDDLARGKYLATIARCRFCHTPRDGQTRQPDLSQQYAGGVPFNLNGGDTLVSMNLTPHEKGLGSWTREQFIARFKLDAVPRPVDPSENTVTSWHAYSGMTETDVGAIYDFLLTLPPKETGIM